MMNAGQGSKTRLALFPGTFDPVTRGHLDILARGLELCDRLIVAVAEGHPKQTLFSAADRVRLIQDALPVAARGRIEILAFQGLLVEFARAHGVNLVVRGLRVISDFEYEFQMALMNKRLWPEIETVFLMPGEELIYLNSTLVKEVARCGGDTSPFVTANVVQALIRKYAGQEI
jgi:pantetheine-phosphate adenylyltransferase